jgi:hypothetical protein
MANTRRPEERCLRKVNLLVMLGMVLKMLLRSEENLLWMILQLWEGRTW